MKNIWNKLKNKWLDYWEDDEFNMIKWHLSQHDKRSLLYGGFIISILTLTVCLFATGSTIYGSHTRTMKMCWKFII